MWSFDFCFLIPDTYLKSPNPNLQSNLHFFRSSCPLETLLLINSTQTMMTSLIQTWKFNATIFGLICWSKITQINCRCSFKWWMILFSHMIYPLLLPFRWSGCLLLHQPLCKTKKRKLSLFRWNRRRWRGRIRNNLLKFWNYRLKDRSRRLQMNKSCICSMKWGISLPFQ